MFRQEVYFYRKENSPKRIGYYFPLFKKHESQENYVSIHHSRNSVIKRDKCCQIYSCSSKRGLQVHHIVPKCLVNERDTVIENGSYNGYFLLKYQQILARHGMLSDTKLMENLKLRINHITNLVLVCSDHHTYIHKPRNKDVFFLKKPPSLMLRPKSLQDEDVMGFFYIMVKETMWFSEKRSNVFNEFTDYFSNIQTLRENLYFL